MKSRKEVKMFIMYAEEIDVQHAEQIAVEHVVSDQKIEYSNGMIGFRKTIVLTHPWAKDPSVASLARKTDDPNTKWFEIEIRIVEVEKTGA